MLESLALRLNLDGVLERMGRMMFFFSFKARYNHVTQYFSISLCYSSTWYNHVTLISIFLFFNMAILLGTIDHLISLQVFFCFMKP